MSAFKQWTNNSAFTALAIFCVVCMFQVESAANVQTYRSGLIINTNNIMSNSTMSSSILQSSVWCDKRLQEWPGGISL